MNWVLVTGALWVLVASVAAPLIGRSIHHANDEQDTAVQLEIRRPHGTARPRRPRSLAGPRSRMVGRCARSVRRASSTGGPGSA